MRNVRNVTLCRSIRVSQKIISKTTYSAFAFNIARRAKWSSIHRIVAFSAFVLVSVLGSEAEEFIVITHRAVEFSCNSWKSNTLRELSEEWKLVLLRTRESKLLHDILTVCDITA